VPACLPAYEISCTPMFVLHSNMLIRVMTLGRYIILTGRAVIQRKDSAKRNAKMVTLGQVRHTDPDNIIGLQSVLGAKGARLNNRRRLSPPYIKAAPLHHNCVRTRRGMGAKYLGSYHLVTHAL